MPEKLPIDAKILLIQKMLDDFGFYKEQGICPLEQSFTIISSDEHCLVETGARFSAFKEMSNGIKKFAFDTRRIDQERDLNPRINLQNWHRTDKFTDDETTKKLVILDKLYGVVKELKAELGNQPEWLESYARILSNNMDRLRTKHDGDSFTEVHSPQVSYVEQLIYNRYRLSIDDIKNANNDFLRTTILKKDSSLNKCRESLISTGTNKVIEPQKTGDITTNNDAVLNLLASVISKNNDSQNKTDATNDRIIALLSQAVNKQEQPKDALTALFGAGSLRSTGEKSVERVITIKIVDTVKDEV